MSRRLIAISVVALGGTAHAQDATGTEATTAPADDVATVDENTGLAPPDMSEQAIGASLGAAIGGRTTAGGVRVVGDYLYQLSDQDWFDGTASFVFGTGGAECFRDRMDSVICDHSLADGYAVELTANVRRFFAGNDRFWPFARAGIGVAIVRFSDDDITGIAFPLHLGGGMRVSITDAVALVGQAEFVLGIARFSGGPGGEPQVGMNVTAGVEFRL